MDGGEEVTGGFVVASCNSSELLELCEEVLDQVAGLVEVAVMVALDHTVFPGRDDNRFPRRLQGQDDPLIGIIAPVSQHRVRFEAREQNVGAVEIASLTAREHEGNRVAQSVCYRVDFCAEAALAATDGLIFSSFFLAPALC